MHPNGENMIVVPMMKRVEIIMSIKVCGISQINFNYKKMVERNAFPANQKHQYHVSQRDEHDCRPITKRMEIIGSIQV